MVMVAQLGKLTEKWIINKVGEFYVMHIML